MKILTKLRGKEEIQAPIFFMHIPKTAGTTLRYMLYEHLQPLDVFPNRKDLKRSKGRYMPWGLLEKKINRFISKRNCKVLIGHYKLPAVVEKFGPNLKTITVLRDPMDRVISHLDHLRRTQEEFNDASLSEILHANPNRFSNLQSKYLGYTPVTKNINEVVENLEKMEVVGTTDNISAVISKLNSLYNWGLKEIPKQNEGNSSLQLKNELSTEDLMLIININKVDSLIYNLARRMQ